MNTVTFDKRKPLTLAGSWQELSYEQGCDLLKMLSKNLKPDECKRIALLILLNVKKSFYLQWIFFWRMSSLEIESMYPLTNFVFKDRTLTKNYLPVVKSEGLKLYGPADNLMDCSFIEFIKADKHYLNYLATKNEAYLDKLIATIYRPKKNLINRLFESLEIFGHEFTSDRRAKYNDDTFSKRLPVVKELSADIKMAILYFYNSSREFMIKHPNHNFIFVKSESGEKSDSNALFKVLDDISGKLFGDFNKTAQTNVYSVFFHINNQIRRNNELEEKYKS